MSVERTADYDELKAVVGDAAAAETASTVAAGIAVAGTAVAVAVAADIDAEGTAVAAAVAAAGTAVDE